MPDELTLKQIRDLSDAMKVGRLLPREAQAELLREYEKLYLEVQCLRIIERCMETVYKDRDEARALAGRLAEALDAFEAWRAVAPGKVAGWRDAAEQAWRKVCALAPAALAEARAAGLLVSRASASHEDVVLTPEGAEVMKQVMDPGSPVGKPVHHKRSRVKEGDGTGPRAG